jgi:hypothetical protein
MDTEWFAVDADGHVARFDSGEDGAVPNDAAIGFSPAESAFDVDALRVACLAEQIVDAKFTDAQPENRSARLLLRVDESYRGAPLPDERFEAIGPLFVSREKLTPDEAAKLAALPNVHVFDLRRVLEHFEGEPLPGVFSFERDHGDDPGLYRREGRPESPVVVDALPPSIRREVAALRLPVRFGDDERLHLGDHLADDEAMYYGADWALRWPAHPKAPTAPKRRPIVAITLVVIVLAAIAWLVARAR